MEWLLRREWNDKELEVLVSAEILNKEVLEGKFSETTHELMLEHRVRDVSQVIAEKAWRLGKKEGLVQGIFLGIVIITLIRIFF